MSTITRANGNGKNTLRDHLQSKAFQEQVGMVLPKHITPERMVRVAMTAINRNPMLAECDQLTFFKCLIDLAAWGLEPDGRRAHLIPFRNNARGTVECQLILDYKGIAELIMRNGQVSYIHADVVCENDIFDYDRGELVSHKVDFRHERGQAYAVYCLVRMRDGTEKCEVMAMEEVQAIRKRSKAGNAGPWVTDFNEMAKKTVFKRLAKWVPWSAEIRDALDKDDEEFRDVVPGTATVKHIEVQNHLDALTERLNEPEALIQEAEDYTTEKAPEPPSIRMIDVLEKFNRDVVEQTSIINVTRCVDQARNTLEQIELDEEIRAECLDEINRLADAKKDAIREKRGK